MITVFPIEKIMLVSWFTYELLPRVEQPEGGSLVGSSTHRWLSGQGDYDGNEAELEVWTTFKGGFGKKKAGRENVGDMTIKFYNCNDGEVTYAIRTDEAGTIYGTSHIERIVPDNIPLCEELDEELRQAG
jgi:hypothetical protein